MIKRQESLKEFVKICLVLTSYIVMYQGLSVCHSQSAAGSRKCEFIAYLIICGSSMHAESIAEVKVACSIFELE